MIVFYLLAVVLANLSVAMFGPRFVVINTFVFVGFDLIARDALHDRWHGQHLRRNMIALVATGSIISALFSLDALRVAGASFIAFMLAGMVDTVAYERLFRRSRFVKMNGSNIPASIIDTFIFVSLAFGFPILWDVVILSVVCKIAGGVFWSMIVTRTFKK